MKNSNRLTLMSLVQAFFQEYLIAHRGLSQNTIAAYRDTLKLFLIFESSRRNTAVAKLTLENITAEAVLLFLEQLENKRNISVVTRNLRLASLRTFATFLTTRDIQRSGDYQRIIALPIKKASRKIIDYLEVNEIAAISNAISLNARGGQRDYVLLSLLYNTGARVQEICDLTVGSITFGSLPFVTLVGKGNKSRQVPIWPETAKLLAGHLRNTLLLNKPTANLFMNANGKPLGRFGVRHIIKKWAREAAVYCPSLRNKTIGPHTYRHTIAMHMLQAGIDLTIIKSWLGHVNLATTHAYVEIDLQMKRRVLDDCSPVGPSKPLQGVLDRNRDILTWLNSF